MFSRRTSQRDRDRDRDRERDRDRVKDKQKGKQKEKEADLADPTMSVAVSTSGSLASPNAIPPRTSSTNQQLQQLQQQLNNGHQSQQHLRNASTGSRSGLKSVPEGDWLANPTALQQQQSQQQQQPGSLRSKPSLPSTPIFAAMTSPPTPPHHPTTAAAAAAPPPPPPDPSRYAYEDLNFTSKKTWTEDKDSVVRGPFDYLNATPGKDFRAQLIGAFNAWLEVPEESLEAITRIVGMLHTASLLVDDVEDSASLRRGLPVAHSIFGVAQTINSANYVYFCALQELQRLRNPKAVSVFADELVNLHRGQGMDLFWRDSLTCPTEEDYLEMVGNKTGGLFRLGIKLMQAESRSLIDCVGLSNLIGLVFQIRDDYMNLSSDEYSQNKGLCEDLTEGKFSFPVIHSIRTDPANRVLINILAQKTADADVKRYAVAHMEKTGSFEYTRKVLAVLIERARNLADEIDEGRGRTKGIHKILDRMAV